MLLVQNTLHRTQHDQRSGIMKVLVHSIGASYTSKRIVAFVHMASIWVIFGPMIVAGGTLVFHHGNKASETGLRVFCFAIQHKETGSFLELTLYLKPHQGV